MRKFSNPAEELAAAKARVEKLQRDSEAKFGKLVVATGAHELPVEVLCGALLDLVGHYRDDPGGLGEFEQSGAAFFRGGSSGRRRPNGGAASAPAGAPAPPPAAGTSPAAGLLAGEAS